MCILLIFTNHGHTAESKSDSKTVIGISYNNNRISNNYLTHKNSDIDSIENIGISFATKAPISGNFYYMNGWEFGIGISDQNDSKDYIDSGIKYQYDTSWSYDLSFEYYLLFLYEIDSLVYFLAGPVASLIYATFNEKTINTVTKEVTDKHSNSLNGLSGGVRLGIGYLFTKNINAELTVQTIYNGLEAAHNGLDDEGMPYSTTDIDTYSLKINFLF